jgi:hydrogenase expression/formation protein HypE
VQLLLKEGIKIHCLRDLTRGGIYTALVELAESSALSLFVDEEQIPICSEVQGACEILGLDPMYVADEGRFIAFIPKEDATNALSILHQYHCTETTMVIGEVTKERSKEAILINIIGTQVRLSRLPGDQLPRIC